jgi:hypothetical protein
MSEAMTVGIVGVVGTLLGVVIAHLLNDRTERIREERRSKEQRGSVRILISTEIEQNLAMFREYWGIVNSAEAKAKTPTSNHEQVQRRDEAVYWSRRLVRHPPPRWVHRSWEALTPSLATALSVSEIEAASRIHSNLDAISAIRAELIEPAAEQPRREKMLDAFGTDIGHWDYPQRLINMAPAAWERIEILAQQILETGNPIEPPVNSAAANIPNIPNFPDTIT